MSVAGPGGDLAVQAGGVLGHQKGKSCPDVLQVCLVQPSRRFLAFAHRYPDTRLFQLLAALAIHQRVGVLEGKAHLHDPCLGDRPRARRRVPPVAARLQGHVEGGPPSPVARLMQRHAQMEACVTIITSQRSNPDGMGRILRDDSGGITAIIEERHADSDTLAIREVNSGFYCFRAPWLWENLQKLAPAPNGELLLTDLIQAAAVQGQSVESITSDDPHETMGVNNRVQLAEAETIMSQRIRERWMLGGVTIPDASSVYIDCDAEIGQDTIVLPNTHITGQTVIGSSCKIGPNAIIDNSTIGDECTITSSVVRDSSLESNVDVGPFSHIRGGAHIESGVHIGTSAEVKNSRLGRGTKRGHFSYMGDATLGANVNIGAGAITCNFDGREKHETVVGNDAFIGSDTMLVAPVRIGDGAATGAGAVVTKDVPANTLVVGVPARERSTERATEKPPASTL